MPEPFFNLEVNSEQLLDGVEVVEEAVDEAKKSLDTLEKEARSKVRTVVGYAQIGWGILQGVIRAAGGSITMTTRLAVSGALGAITMMAPIIKAKGIMSLITGDIPGTLMALSGLAQLGSAMAALITFESEQRDLSLQLRGLNFMFRNMSMMFSGMKI